MGGHEDGGAALADVMKDLKDLCSGFGVEVPGGFVGKDESWCIEERASDDDALLLTAGEFVGHFVAFIGHANL